jgi:hypothetical protein
MPAGTIFAGALLGIFGLVFLALGLYWLFPAFKLVQTALSSIRWPSVEGHVVSTAIHTEHYTDTEFSSDTRKNHGRRLDYDYYRPIIRYTYQVGGAHYTSSQRAPGDPQQYPEIKQARDILKKFRADQPIKVYYDPKDPKDAVLEPGSLGPSMRKLGTSFVMLFLGWFVLKIAMAIFSGR